MSCHGRPPSRLAPRVLSTAVPVALALSPASGLGPGAPASHDAPGHVVAPQPFGASEPSGASSGARLASTTTGARWTWPLRPRPVVVHAFSAPASPYGPGHRGVDLATTTDGAVRAVQAGIITHVGTVAGRGTVTIAHAAGLRSTYEPVRSALGVGDGVEAGEVIGLLESRPGHCGASACLHLGARVGRVYLDPLVLLDAGPVVLLPLNPADAW